MKLRDSLLLFILTLATLLAASPILLSGGVINTASGDTPFVLFKIQQTQLALTQFVLPVRWLPDAALGLGYPLFNYDSSLAFYLAAIFKTLGASYSLALKLTQLLALLLSSFTLYAYARALHFNRYAATLAALAYLFAPFHLTNIFSRADSLGELFAFALVPLTLHLLHLTTVSPSPRTNLLFTLTLSALILSHPPSGLIFLPILIAYTILNNLARPLFILHLSFFIILSFALTAFYWFPAWRELSYIRAENPLVSGYAGFNLIQLSFLFNYDTNPNALSWMQILLIAFGLFAFVVRRHTSEENVSPLMGFTMIIGFAGSTFMVTRLSQTLWEVIPFLNYVQYAWRFFLPQTLFASLLIGFILQSAALAEASWRDLLTNTRVRVVLAGMALYCLIHLVGVRPDYITLTENDLTTQRFQLYEAFSGHVGGTRNGDYLPKWMEAQPTTSDELTNSEKNIGLKTLSGNASGGRLGKGAASQVWQVNVSSSSAVITLPLTYFPGWAGKVNGRPLELRRVDGSGWVAFEVPSGEHRIELDFGNTLARSAASIISIITLLFVAGWLIYSLRELPDFVSVAHAVVYGGAILVVLIFFVVVEQFFNLQRQTNAATTMDVKRQALLHSDEVRFANEEVLRSYTLSSETPAPGDVLTVNLNWQGTSRGDFILELVTPASLGTITRVNGKVSAATTSATLPIPRDLSGMYWVRLLYTENGETIPALTSNGQPRETIFLKPIFVSGNAVAVTAPVAGQRLTELPPLKFKSGAVFGSITLGGYELNIKNRVLTLNLYWQGSNPAPKSYKAFVHLFDPATGKVIAQSDTYPTITTNNWLKNEVVVQAETFALSKLPAGIYNLGVGWYDEATNQRIGERAILSHAVVVP